MDRLERFKAEARCSAAAMDGCPAATPSKLVCVPALGQWDTAVLHWFQSLRRSCSWSVGTGGAEMVRLMLTE